MPRSYNLYPQNAQVTSNPLNMLSFDPTSIVKTAADYLSLPDAATLTLDAIEGLLREIANVPGGIEAFVNAILSWIDDVTGLDFLSFAQGLESLFGSNSLLGGLLGSVTGMLGNWTSLFGALGITDSSGLATQSLTSNEVINDIITAIQTLIGSPIAFIGQLIDMFVGAGSGIAGLTGLTTIISDLLGLLGNPIGLGTGSALTTLPAAVLQPLIDAISQGFGGAVGLGFSALQSLLAAVPGLSQLLSDVGVSTLAQFVASLGGLLPAVLDNLDGTGIATGVAQIVDNLDGTATLTNLLGSSPLASLVDNFDGTAMSVAALLQNLTGGSTPIIATSQNLLDSITNMMTGGAQTGNSLAQAEAALQSIPSEFVQGVLGPSNVGGSIGSIVDQLTQALGGLVGSGFGLGQLANAASVTAGTAANAATTSENNSTTLANRAVFKPSYQSIDPTADGVFHITTLVGSSPTTVGVSANASVIGFIGTPDAGVKESIVWLGQTTANITAMYLNVYSVNITTGVLTLVYSSPDVSGSVSNPLGWNYYNLPSADYITSAQGNWYAVEMQVTGTGTYQVAGIPNHWLPANPNAYPKQLGATRAPTAPTVDTIGGGAGVNAASASWSHTIDASANSLVVVLNCPGTISSVKVGTTSMALLKQYTYFSTSFDLYFYQLANPPTGAQTITVTLSGANFITANSVSLIGVSGFGTASTANNTGTSLSQTVTAAANELILQAFAVPQQSTPVFSAYNQTTLWNKAAGASNYPLIIGDAAGASSVTFSATVSVNSNNWGGVGIPVLGAVPSAPSSISSPSYSSNVPWFGLSGSAGVTQHPPQTTQYNTSGSHTYTIPTWANFVDVIAVGAGGQGSCGQFGAGSNGTSSTATVGGTTVTGTAGVGGANGAYQFGQVADDLGQSPGNHTFNGVSYFGGVVVGSQVTGSAPGGGGGGGVWSGFYAQGGRAGSWAAQTFSVNGSTGITTVSVTVGLGGPYAGQQTPGSPGADGAVWIVARP